nr:MAG TPA: hypothetical protein [Bacteriophage sp.]
MNDCKAGSLSLVKLNFIPFIGYLIFANSNKIFFKNCYLIPL